MKSEPGKVTMAEAISATASVEAVDKAKRLITLKGPQGNTFVVQAGPEVKNFDQIKVGDLVIVKYVEALTLELKPGGGQIRERIERENMASAKPGDPPAAVAGRTVTVIADVIGIDAAKQTVKLKGPKRTVDLKVQGSEPAQADQGGRSGRGDVHRGGRGLGGARTEEVIRPRSSRAILKGPALPALCLFRRGRRWHAARVRSSARTSPRARARSPLRAAGRP